MSLITIGIPVVKSHFIQSALEGALNQTYKNIEVIVINDSPTETGKSEIRMIVNSFKDDRLKYLENETPLGQIQNMNKTLEHAAGEYFALLCDDDKWAPTYLEEMMTLAKKHPQTDIFHCRVVYMNEHDINTDLAPLLPEKQDYLDFIYHRIRGWSRFTLSDFTLRTAALRNIGGFQYMLDGWGSDDITWFRLAVNGGVAYSPKPLYYYRINSFNISNTKGIKKKYKSIAVYVDYVKKLLAEQPFTDNEMDLFRQNLIMNQLNNYKKSNYTYLVDKGLREHKHIPDFLVPVMMLFYKGYMKTFGW